MPSRKRTKHGSSPGRDNGCVADTQLPSHSASAPGILALPPELLEDILVLLVDCGHPKTISALARTCQALRRLIYAPQDKFLWRRIFLTTFDDPRSIQSFADFNWASEYQARVKASLFIERHYGAPATGLNRESRRHSLRSATKATPSPTRTRRRASESIEIAVTSGTNYTVALQTLLSILDTSHPVTVPLHGAAKQPWENPGLIASTLREASLRAPPFPPYIVTALPDVSDAVSVAATDGKSDGDATELPPVIRPSRSLAYLKRLLSSGVVPDLVSYLATPATNERGSPWQSTPEAQALNRLVATFGISVFLDTPHRDRRKHKDEADTVHRNAIYARTEGSNTLMELFARIRHASQKKVYDMNYLSRKRAWGPFLRVRSNKDQNQDAASVSTTDAEDADYQPIPEDTPSDSAASTSEEDSEDAEYVPPHAQGPRARKPAPQPEDLQADWEHLAAIRIVVQAKLEEKLRLLQTDLAQWFDPGQAEEIMRTLFAWEGVRSCVWTGARAACTSEEGEASKPRSPQKDSTNDADAASSSAGVPPLFKSPSEPLAEWDWAGVEGIWRRCVCWLDYENLIYQNRLGFQERDLDEATITVPLALRVTGFSPSTLPEYAQYPTIHFDSRRFPTIHVEGTMGGADWAFNGGAQQDVRRVKGTVRVCRDGSVWWSMLSSVQGSHEEWEWSSEGIQIGAALGPGGPIGVRSGSGILGLWTGWEHEFEDPIGAWWQWKVA